MCKVAARENPEAFRLKLGQIHPAGRTGKPEEVAAIVAFLAAAESGFVCRQNDESRFADVAPVRNLAQNRYPLDRSDSSPAHPPRQPTTQAWPKLPRENVPTTSFLG